MIDSDKIVEQLRVGYFGHTTETPTKEDWELLETHLREVALLTSQFAKEIGMEDEGYVAGILHDIGKYSEKMQSRFEDNSIRGINHWSNGSLQAFKLGYSYAIFCIEGHHVGLPNAGELGAILRKMGIREFYEKITGFQEPHESLLNKFIKRGMEMPLEMKGGHPYNFSSSFMVRMLFSCLVDADRISTSKFCNGIKKLINPLEKEFPPLCPDKALSILMEEVSKKSTNTTMGRLRTHVLEDCLSAAELSPGLFTLTVPTGGAKTISSTAFALKHSIKYSKKKIIYVLPFTTIIDQTGDVLTESKNPNSLTLKFNKHFGDNYVLEHHSTLEVDKNLMGDYRIGTTTWRNPMIVTTTLQFFESLFSNHPSKCQKLHNIPNSVIILDEVQTLPPKLLKSLLTIIQVLIKEYGCSVVFCSATVPAFESVKLDTPWNPIEICSNPIEMSDILKRCDIIIRKDAITHEQLAKETLLHDQCLTVVNTKHDALRIFNRIMTADGCYHLSTNMCAKHRKLVIEQIRNRLNDGLTCRVVSTQLIEAGIDVDFPHGYRVIAPMDSIIQTAGRINREGKMKKNGILEIINLVDAHSPMGEYNTRISITNSFLSQHEDLKIHSPESYREYYKQMYALVGKDTDNVFIASSNFQFKTVSEECRLINDLTVSVIVPYEDGERYIEQIKKEKEVPSWMYRKLQLLSVNVYSNKLSQMINDGTVMDIKCGDSTVYYLNSSNYDESMGMIWNPPKPQDYIL